MSSSGSPWPSDRDLLLLGARRRDGKRHPQSAPKTRFQPPARLLPRRSRAPDRIGWGIATGPVGDLLITWTPRGLHAVTFIRRRTASSARAAEAELARKFPRARIERDDREAAGRAASLLAAAQGRGTRRTGRRGSDADPEETGPILIDTTGTPFDRRVWRALLAVPPGTTTTYGALARTMGAPRACRAVGNSVKRNPIGILIPCHRVLRSDGSIGGFAWGERVKRAILDWERQGT